jgi:hypothetical protein
MEFSNELDTGQQRNQLKIADRRWRWAGQPQIFYEVNVRDASGSVIVAPAETTVGWYYESGSQIAESLLVGALGETGSHSIQLPHGTLPAQRPPFMWDKVTPASALHELCEFYDAQVTLNPASNMIIIFADGSFLDDPTTAPAVNMNREEYRYMGEPIPGQLMVYGGKRRIEVDIPLVPVVVDVDGSVKTYGTHPVAGTRHCTWLPPVLPSVFAEPAAFASSKYPPKTMPEKTAERAVIKECAAKSFYRYYQLPGTVALYTEGDDGTDYLYMPALSHRVILERNHLELITGDIKYAKAQLFGTGIVSTKINDDSAREDSKRGIIPVPFALDKTTGIVRTEKRVCSVHGKGNESSVQPGTLWLRAVVADQPIGYVGTTGITGADPSYLYTEAHDDLVYEYGSGGTNNGTATNAATMTALANSYLSVMSQKYTRIAADNPLQTFTWPGIHKFACDGIYQQVTWNIGFDKAPQTVVSWDCDHNVRESTEYARQSVWQGKMMRDRLNRAQKVNEETHETKPTDSEF